MLRGSVHVGYGGSTSGQRWGAEEASQETEGEEHAEVRCERSWNLEENEDHYTTISAMKNSGHGVNLTQRRNINRIASELRNLTHGRPQERTQAVTSNEKSKTKRSRNLAYAELLHHAHQTWRVDGGSDVYAEGQEHDFTRDEELLGL